MVNRADSRHVRSTHCSFLAAQSVTSLKMVHGRLRGKIQALIGKLWHKLLRWQTRVSRTRQYTHDLCFLDG